MNIEEAKRIFINYQSALDKSTQAGYTIAAPLSFLQNSIEEIKQAIKIIYTHVSYTTKVTEKELGILRFGYWNLSTFISDIDAKAVLGMQKLLQEVKNTDESRFREFLTRNKNSTINSLESFIQIEKRIQQKGEQLDSEFENFSSEHHLNSKDSTETRGKKVGRKLGYNLGALYYTLIKKIKGKK